MRPRSGGQLVESQTVVPSRLEESNFAKAGVMGYHPSKQVPAGAFQVQ